VECRLERCSRWRGVAPFVQFLKRKIRFLVWEQHKSIESAGLQRIAEASALGSLIVSADMKATAVALIPSQIL
jgi:hypothetical protein